MANAKSKYIKTENGSTIIFKKDIIGFDIANPSDEDGNADDSLFCVVAITIVGNLLISKYYKTIKGAIACRDKFVKEM